MSDNEQRTQPGFPGFGFIQCHQMDCRNRAAYRYVWPGSGRWAAICEIDKPKLMAAAVLVEPFDLVPLTEAEHNDPNHPLVRTW